jgi:hypothetical protein
MPDNDRPTVCLTPAEVGRRWSISAERVVGLIRAGVLDGINVAPGNGKRWADSVGCRPGF